MLWGRYASNAREARYPQLWRGRVFGVCPSVQGPAGLNVYDTTGRGLHGVLSGMDAPTDWVRYAGRYALVFDGTNQCITLPTVTLSGPFTLSSWVNRASGTTERDFLCNSGNASVYFGVSSVQAYLAGSTSGQKLFSLSPSNGVWNHLVVTRDGGNTARVWLNGAESSTGGLSMTGNMPINVVGKYASGIGGDAPYNWLGAIDDVAFFNRCLTPGEIRLLATRRGIAYEARRDMFGGSSGFQAYWVRRQNQIIGGGVR